MEQTINLIIGETKFYLITPHDPNGNTAPIQAGSLRLELRVPDIVKIEQNPDNEFHFRVDAHNAGEADLNIVLVNTIGAEVFHLVKFIVSDGAGIATGIKVSETTPY